MSLTILVPAHNEETRIGSCIASLGRQTQKADSIVVIADNCTDRTAEKASQAGAEVFETRRNNLAKAGGLNQWLSKNLDAMSPDEEILVVDADGELDCDFIEQARKFLSKGYAAVGGVFRAEDNGNFVGHCQASEYERYRYLLRRSRGKTLVLTGTATLFKADTLQRVVAAREAGAIPSSQMKPEAVYSTQTLTEDLELTMAVKSLDLKVIAPIECSLVTEAMPTFAALRRQRYRWKFGALETAWLYRRYRCSWVFHRLQIWNLMGIFATLVYLFTLVWSVAGGTFHLMPLWILVTFIFAFERAVTVSGRGWKASAVAALLLPEMVFDITLQMTQLKAVFDWLFKTSKKGWYG